MYKLDADLKYTWKSRQHPRVTHLQDRVCLIPRYTLSIDTLGRCFHCICDGWLPWPSGHLPDFNSMDEIFNNPVAKKLQKSTEYNGSFKFCNTARCGIRTESSIPVGDSIFEISVGIDESCNLKCPSCREIKIFYKSGPDFQKRKDLMDHFSFLLSSFEKPCVITIGANGDAFASHIYRNFLYTYQPLSNQQFILKTNGLLIKKQFKSLPTVNNIKKLSISVDAATKETYQKIRFPGVWDHLIANLDMISFLEKKVELNFVIQKSNFYDIYPFLDMCKKYNFTPHFSLLEDWGTWHDYTQHTVHLPTNELYSEWLVVKEDLIKKMPGRARKGNFFT